MARKNINTTLDEELYKSIRILALQKGVNANDLIEEGMKLINSLDYAEALFITDEYELLYSNNFPKNKKSMQQKTQEPVLTDHFLSFHSLKPFLQLTDYLLRTFFRTSSAINTLIIINMCNIVFYSNCRNTTKFFTHFTSNTSTGTYAHHIFSFVL